MNLKPPSIVLPLAGAAAGFLLAGRNYWAIGAGALAGALGNALLNLAAVKNDAAVQLGADVGLGPKVPGASLSKEFLGSLTGESPKPIYSQAALSASQVEQALPAPMPKKSDEVASGTSSDPQAVQNWLQQIAKAGQQQAAATMGYVSGPPIAKPAKKVPAAARFRAGR